MDDEVRCPKCKSLHFTRKGKSKDKQFQKLRCKKCGKNWSVELFKVNKQIQLPEIKIAIVHHPDGMYSINKIQITKIENKQIIRNAEFLTEKTKTYSDIVHLASMFAVDISPNVVKLDEFVPDILKQQINILFPSAVSKKIINLFESMCKDLSWMK
jgi:transposase-like protein